MNLFVKSLDDYLKQACNEMLQSDLKLREARFIVQSLGPDDVFALFSSLDDYKLEQQKERSLKCYFRVATGLWQEWCREPNAEAALKEKMAKLGAIGDDGEYLWIDEDDKLTWYRNRTVSDEQVDNIIIVLVGLNHATDQGGLSDFHRLDEARIWGSMGRTFMPWLTLLCKHLDINTSEAALEPFNAVFLELFSLRPLQLSKFSRFIQTELVKGENIYSLEELVERFYTELPSWGIPPIIFEGYLGKKGLNYLKQANKFISHQSYKSLQSQNKDWKKIERWLISDDFEMPLNTKGTLAFISADEYKEVLESFVYEADISARDKLLKVDVLPLLKILTVSERKKKTSRKSIKSFKSSALEAFLSGIKDTLESYQNSNDILSLMDNLTKLTIEVVHFGHDMVADEAESLGREELAEKLLISCLGGLEDIFNNLDCRLPQDEPEAKLAREQWSRNLEVEFDTNNIAYGVSRTSPKVLFRVTAQGISDDETVVQEFYWQLSETQPERVMAEGIRLVREQWQQMSNSSLLLPAFRVRPENMSALYYAADEDEANRLLSQAMTDMKIFNLIEDLPDCTLGQELSYKLLTFIEDYKKWLDAAFTKGFHSTINSELTRLLQTYTKLIEATLNKECKGSVELLRRLYKAFFIVDDRCLPNDAYLSAAIAWGLSPAVLEQMNAKVRFLADGFPEVIAEVVINGKGGRTFERLLDLSQIKRPVSALVNDENTLSADIKSYGLLHYLGTEPKVEMSLAVQTLLRETDLDDEEGIKESTRPCQETKIVSQVIEDYMRLHPYSEDGLRILAVNVKDLQTILSGLDSFLSSYLLVSDNRLDFHFSVMVYTSAASPMVMENRLKLWREQLQEKFGDENRGLQLTVGHQFALHSRIPQLLKNEAHSYDIAFLFHFLEDGLQGRIEPAKPFEFNFDDCAFFPVAEYPRPINSGEKNIRQNLISNRRLSVQTRHADMSARLCYNGHDNSDHIVYGRVDFQPWQSTLDALHKKGYWVACIDSFVDKKLMMAEHDSIRKIVGFASGLGSYGELNLTISTQRDTLKQLSDIVKNRLKGLFPSEAGDKLEMMASSVVKELEKIVGLSSLRAVVGDDERIREVIGFAAIHRTLKAPNGAMSQLVPLDDFRHWFTDNDSNMRPDLLQLTLEVRQDDIPLIHANVVECKLAQTNSTHLEKAIEQVEVGLSYLPTLLAPKTSNLNANEFDRRYWWAQLHRALSSRSDVQLSEHDWQELTYALEQVADGEFEIHWRASIFTFWTDCDEQEVRVDEILPSLGAVKPPFLADKNFAIQHVIVGYKALSQIFSTQSGPTLLDNTGGKVVLRASRSKQFSQWDDVNTENVTVTQETDSSIVSAPITSVELNENEAKSVHLLDKVNYPPIPQELAISLPKDDQSAAITSTILRRVAEPSVSFEEKNIVELEKVSSHESSHDEEIVGDIKFNVPEKILIGTRQNGEPVYWYFGHPKLDNRHILIFGSSGSGKTYGIQCLLSELAQQQVHSFIIDYTNGFLPSQVEMLFKEYGLPKDYIVRTDGLPLNPFRRQQQVIDPSLPVVEETASNVAHRIASIFTSVFSSIGDQQSAALIRALTAGLDNDVKFTFSKLLEPLRSDSTQGESLANRLQPFVESNLFNDTENQAWEQMLRMPERGVHILQLASYSRDIQKIVTEFALWDLWDYVQNTGNKDCPIPVVLDEIQNLDHSDDSPLDKMLREGRKFGLGMILATQTISQFNQDQRARLFLAGHKLFFKPASTEVDRFADILAQSTPGTNKADWAARLNKLEKGQCWSLGPVEKSNGTMVTEAVLVSVTPFEERVFGV